MCCSISDGGSGLWDRAGGHHADRPGGKRLPGIRSGHRLNREPRYPYRARVLRFRRAQAGVPRPRHRPHGRTAPGASEGGLASTRRTMRPGDAGGAQRAGIRASGSERGCRAGEATQDRAQALMRAESFVHLGAVQRFAGYTCTRAPRACAQTRRSWGVQRKNRHARLCWWSRRPRRNRAAVEISRHSSSPLAQKEPRPRQRGSVLRRRLAPVRSAAPRQSYLARLSPKLVR